MIVEPPTFGGLYTIVRSPNSCSISVNAGFCVNSTCWPDRSSGGTRFKIPVTGMNSASTSSHRGGPGALESRLPSMETPRVIGHVEALGQGGFGCGSGVGRGVLGPRHKTPSRLATAQTSPCIGVIGTPSLGVLPNMPGRSISSNRGSHPGRSGLPPCPPYHHAPSLPSLSVLWFVATTTAHFLLNRSAAAC